MGILKRKVYSERKWNATFRGLRTFAQIDFQYFENGRIHIFDGKGHKVMNADPRQVQWYALTVAASGKDLGGGGFIYWKHGFDPIKLDPTSIQEFIKRDVDKAFPVLQRLKKGTDDLPPNPSPSVCNLCKWKKSCNASPYFMAEVTNPTTQEVKL